MDEARKHMDNFYFLLQQKLQEKLQNENILKELLIEPQDLIFQPAEKKSLEKLNPNNENKPNN